MKRLLLHKAPAFTLNSSPEVDQTLQLILPASRSKADTGFVKEIRPGSVSGLPYKRTHQNTASHRREFAGRPGRGSEAMVSANWESGSCPPSHLGGLRLSSALTASLAMAIPRRHPCSKRENRSRNGIRSASVSNARATEPPI